MATVRALETLVAVAETGSLTSAAVRLHLSQPALSHQVRALEDEVGAALVVRLPRGVRLTAVGEAMLESARSATLAASRAVALGRAVAQGHQGSLRVACAESMTAGLLAPALIRWRRDHPGVVIELRERLSADQLAGEVLLGESDLAIGPSPSPGALETSVLLRESFVAIVASDHPFSSRGSLRLADLAGEPFVHLDALNGLSGWLDTVAAAAAVVLQPVVRVRTTTTVAALAAAGLGVGIVPSTTVRTSAGVSIPLDPPLSREVVTMRQGALSPVAAAFCDTVRQSA